MALPAIIGLIGSILGSAASSQGGGKEDKASGLLQQVMAQPPQMSTPGGGGPSGAPPQLAQGASPPQMMSPPQVTNLSNAPGPAPQSAGEKWGDRAAGLASLLMKYQQSMPRTPAAVLPQIPTGGPSPFVTQAPVQQAPIRNLGMRRFRMFDDRG